MWKEEDNCLKAEFVFEDFRDAFSFMAEVGIIAEQMNHHPEWTNIYNKVWIKLSTHSAGNTVTEKDREMARMIDTLFL
ncbi:MAG: 4a-hydroxytetrahydrobiopterin dehydratase [Bacteroidia bacterium]|nr:4a-hydroxytetrahydrobiopterin dehydratase [Bacteroidia bacterium]